ncbi:MAG: restriction endonuclease subunit S [Alcanivorax sp.]
MNEWQDATVDEVCTRVFSGGTPNTQTSSFWGGEIPWLSSGETRQRFIFDTEKKITNNGVKNSSTKLAKRGSIVIASAGQGHTRGQTSFLEFDTYINQSVVCLEPDTKKVIPLWLFYNLSNRYDEMRQLSDGHSSRGSLTTVILKEMKLNFPPLQNQKAVSDFLYAIDQKIELNQRMNETLEGMARAIFKSWFADFDPVHAKAEGREPEGMDSATAALFPSTFTPDGLPEGWEKTTLEKIAKLNPESWGKNNHPDNVEYVDLANTKWGVIESTQQYIWNDAPSRARRVLQNEDTIVGTVRPGNGSYSYIGASGLTGSTGFAVLRPKKSEYAEAVFCAATSKDNIERLAHLADGGAYPAVRPDVVFDTPFIFACEEIISAFSDVTKLFVEKIEANKKQNQTLAALRDTLLPKLISGELRVDTVTDTLTLKEAAG